MQVLRDEELGLPTIICDALSEIFHKTPRLPIEMWHHFIGDDTIADAVCDRVINNAQKIQITGDSTRKNEN